MKCPVHLRPRWPRLPLCVCTVAAWAVAADSIVLKPAADTALAERFPDHNYGAAWLVAGTMTSGGRTRALLRFDLSALPTNAAIQSASLKIDVVRSSLGAVNSAFELRPVQVSWGEGNKGTQGVGDGAPAARGEATWTARFLAQTNWSVPGGAVGTDFAHDPSSQTQVAGNGSYTFPSTANLVADLQRWVADPAVNFGWMLATQDEGKQGTGRRFGSRETAGQEPVLTIDYTIPVPPLRFDGIRLSGNQVLMPFQAEAGILYAVEYISGAGLTNWALLTNFGSKFIPTNFVAEDSILSAPRRCYRLRNAGTLD